ncbi:unnamed protein product [Penicillium egyptiacum]|uniref:DUF7136 domain-containing protein n=1 Tax=Penicillium egyptiacum TaxID=1303716 RepID=A0A9W4P155_9EURO|nr:unnamed protein product [Penicillium egyptiacum]
MRIPWASWLLAACMGTTINASNILEVDLVFPRNETYAPTEWFPVVFAVQNPERARYLNLGLEYILWNLDDSNDVRPFTHELRWANWTDKNPYLAHEFTGMFRNEGRWKVTWTLMWESCNEYAFENHRDVRNMISNMTSWSTWFTTQSTAPKVDLVAATANKTCLGQYGMAINVTDKTMQVPQGVTWSGGGYTNDTCVVVASSTQTPRPDPCRVDIDKTIVASMEASLKNRLCNWLDPPADCPKDDKNAGQQLAVAGVSCLLAAFGALGFFLM